LYLCELDGYHPFKAIKSTKINNYKQRILCQKKQF
jgi:hypothetical protein